MNPDRVNKVVGDPTMGDPTVDQIKPTALDAKPTIQVGQPAIGTDYAFGGITKSADVTNASAPDVTGTYSPENRSAQYKNPQVKQDTVAEDRVAKPDASI